MINFKDFRAVTYFLLGLLFAILGSLAVYFSDTINKDHPTWSRLLLTAGVVLVTSLVYKVLHDFFLRPSEQAQNEITLRKMLEDHIIGNRVKIIMEEKDLLIIFQNRLDSSRHGLICCGTSLIKISNQLSNLSRKLKDNRRYKIDIYLFSPSNRNDLIKDYMKSTQEDEFINHLRMTYTAFLQLSAEFRNQVNIYLYHTLPFFSCVIFDQGKEKESMIVRHYINGKYPPDCPAIELDSTHEIDKRIINEHMAGIEFLQKNSFKLQIDRSVSTYWDERSLVFDNLSWVVDQELIEQIISLSCIKKENEVLEIGSGTGILAEKIGNSVGVFLGVDISKEMVCISNQKQIPNTFFMYGDARDLRYFSEYRFDIVFARMVLHHVTQNLTKCLTETFRVLKRGGKFIVCENVPLTNDDSIAEFHQRCLQVKEERITFNSESLKTYIKSVGFKIDDNRDVKPYILQVSLDNWLRNNNLDEERKRKIKEMFDSMPDEVRTKLNCISINGDYLFNIKFIILVATK